MNNRSLSTVFAGRPVWMNALMLFCAYMTIFYMPFDLFYKPVEKDAEVWFGVLLHGWAAKATEPVHWAIYAAGFYGFLRMKSWMFPWAAVYTLQVAIAMAVFPWLYHEASITAGAMIAIPFLVLSAMLIAARNRFDGNGGMVRDSVPKQPVSE